MSTYTIMPLGGPLPGNSLFDLQLRMCRQFKAPLLISSVHNYPLRSSCVYHDLRLTMIGPVDRQWFLNLTSNLKNYIKEISGDQS